MTLNTVVFPQYFRSDDSILIITFYHLAFFFLVLSCQSSLQRIFLLQQLYTSNRTHFIWKWYSNSNSSGFKFLLYFLSQQCFCEYVLKMSSFCRPLEHPFSLILIIVEFFLGVIFTFFCKCKWSVVFSFPFLSSNSLDHHSFSKITVNDAVRMLATFIHPTARRYII